MKLEEYQVREATINILKGFVFKDDLGEPIVWTHGQLVIIDCILHKESITGSRRIHIESLTQYGKSAAVGAGVTLRCAFKGEPFALVAGTKEKARIIMEYVVRYSLDNAVIAKMLEVTEPLDKLRMRKSQDRLSYNTGGEVRVFSADSKNKQSSGDALMGFGCPNVIEDESALIDDDMHAKVMRMLGGYKDGFLVKIGNPFRRNHFYKSSMDARYFKVHIDWRDAVREGRMTQDYIDEMREQPLFDVLYEVLFPDEDLIDSKGWMQLVPHSLLERAIVDNVQLFGEMRLGNDVAGGGRNYSVTVLKGHNGAKVVYKERQPNSMAFAGEIIKFMRQFPIAPEATFIDRVGIGKGCYDRVNEQFNNGGVIGVSGADTPVNKELFANSRAEQYWNLKLWLNAGGQLEKDKHNDWSQIGHIRYKVNSSGKIIIISKEELMRNGIDSPDVADALALTFARPVRTPRNRSNHVATEVSPTNDDPYAYLDSLP